MKNKLIIMILITCSFAFAGTNNFHFKPKSALSKTRLDIRQVAMQKSEFEESKSRLEQRVQWMEQLNQYVYHNKAGKKIFPYEQKIKFLKNRLKNFDKNSDTRM